MNHCGLLFLPMVKIVEKRNYDIYSHKAIFFSLDGGHYCIFLDWSIPPPVYVYKLSDKAALDIYRKFKIKERR